MAQPNPNPFASPELEDVSSSEAAPLASSSAGRWIGLSALSGSLLFAAYLVACVAIFLVGSIFFAETMAFWDTLQTAITPIAIYCLIAGAYGALIGSMLGLGLGVLSFTLRDRNPLSLLILIGVPGSLLVTFVPLILLLGGLDPRSAVGILAYWWMVAVVGSLLAGSHLVANVYRFLLLPYVEQKQNQV